MEAIKAIEQAIQDRLTLMTAISVIGSVIGAIVGAFFGSYLKKWGEQRAADEHFKELKRQISEQTKVTEGIKAELSGELWIGQKQWELKREIYKSVLEVIDETRVMMKGINYRWGAVPLLVSSPGDEEAARLEEEAARRKKERQEKIDDARTKIAAATQNLRQTAVFSAVVLKREATQALWDLVDMLEVYLMPNKEGDEEPKLGVWIEDTDRIYSILMDEARQELAAMGGRAPDDECRAQREAKAPPKPDCR